MPELQGVGHDQAAVELRGGLGMPFAVSLVGWIVVHFMIGLAGTWVARRYALHRRLLDEPGERRSHVATTPRGGGISIVAALVLALVALAAWHPDQARVLLGGAAGLLLVATVGWIDDHRPLSAALRLLVHAVAAVILALGVYRANDNGAEACVVFAAALILVNVWNFMDGIDGLAASQAVIIGLGYSLYVVDDPAAFALALALVASTCGFLPFNFPKARIFLGDVGSGSLGFALAAILATALSAPPRLPATVQFAWLVPLSAFTIDTSLTLMKRIVGRKRWWTAHLEHAYQQWAARAQGHVGVTAAYAMWTMLGVGLMLLIRMPSMQMPSMQMLSMHSGSAAFIMAAVIAWHLLGVAAWIWLQDRGRISSKGS